MVPVTPYLIRGIPGTAGVCPYFRDSRGHQKVFSLWEDLRGQVHLWARGIVFLFVGAGERRRRGGRGGGWSFARTGEAKVRTGQDQGVRLLQASPRSCGDPFLSDRPVDADAAGLQIGFFHEEEEHDRIVFQAQIGAELTGPLVFGETVGNRVQDNSDIDVALGRQLVAGTRAIKVYGPQMIAVDLGQAPVGLGRDLQCLLPRRYHTAFHDSPAPSRQQMKKRAAPVMERSRELKGSGVCLGKRSWSAGIVE